MLWTSFRDEKRLENILRRYFSSYFSALNIFLILVFRPPRPFDSHAVRLSAPSPFLLGTSQFLSRQTSFIIREQKMRELQVPGCASQYGQDPGQNSIPRTAYIACERRPPCKVNQSNLSLRFYHEDGLSRFVRNVVPIYQTA
jgi:hypothetical protein